MPKNMSVNPHRPQCGSSSPQAAFKAADLNGSLCAGDSQLGPRCPATWSDIALSSCPLSDEQALHPWYLHQEVLTCSCQRETWSWCSTPNPRVQESPRSYICIHCGLQPAHPHHWQGHGGHTMTRHPLPWSHLELACLLPTKAHFWVHPGCWATVLLLVLKFIQNRKLAFDFSWELQVERHKYFISRHCMPRLFERCPGSHSTSLPLLVTSHSQTRALRWEGYGHILGRGVWDGCEHLRARWVASLHMALEELSRTLRLQQWGTEWVVPMGRPGRSCLKCWWNWVTHLVHRQHVPISEIWFTF